MFSQTSAVQVNVIFLTSKVSGEKDKLRQDKIRIANLVFKPGTIWPSFSELQCSAPFKRKKIEMILV